MEDGIEQYRSMLLDLNERKKKTDEKKEIRREEDRNRQEDRTNKLFTGIFQTIRRHLVLYLYWNQFVYHNN